jgi:hypothetical protein
VEPFAHVIARMTASFWHPFSFMSSSVQAEACQDSSKYTKKNKKQKQKAELE